MSTANKLTYLNTTKGEIKQGINNLGGNLTNNSTFRSYGNELDTVYSKLPKVTAEGSYVTLNNTMNAKIGSILKGNSLQDAVVTGDNSIKIQNKNLLNKNNVSAENSATLEITQTGFNITRTHASGYGDEFIASCVCENLEKNTTYTFNFDVETENTIANGFIYVYNDRLFGTSLSKTNYVATGNNRKWNITTDSKGKIVIGFYGTTAMKDKIIQITNIQLEKGSSVTEYIQYEEQIYPINLGNIELSTGDSINGTIDNWNILRADTTTIEITDTTLIGQLNNLYYAKSCEGTTNITAICETDNIPFIIKASALIAVAKEDFELDSGQYLFYGGARLSAVTNLLNHCKSSGINCRYMFQYAQTMQTLDLSGVNKVKVTNANSMFTNCTNLTSIDLTKFDFSDCYDFTQMFRYDAKLTSVNLTGFTNGGSSTFQSMFDGCKLLTEADISSFDYPLNTSAGMGSSSGMFYGCIALTKLIINNPNGFKMSNVDMLTNTPIASGTGYVYVPDNLVDTYKADSNWSTYANQIKGMSELPS